jgi:hypothetical protein
LGIQQGFEILLGVEFLNHLSVPALAMILSRRARFQISQN